MSQEESSEETTSANTDCTKPEILAETKWIILNKKDHQLVDLTYKLLGCHAKLIYVPSILVQIKEPALTNGLKPIASMLTILPDQLKPCVQVDYASVGIVTLSNLQDTKQQYYGMVYLMRDGSDYQLAYYPSINGIIIPAGQYSISDVYINYF